MVLDLTKSTLLSFKMSGMLAEHNRPNPLTGDIIRQLARGKAVTDAG